jgi:hypothetical protein
MHSSSGFQGIYIWLFYTFRSVFFVPHDYPILFHGGDAMKMRLWLYALVALLIAFAAINLPVSGQAPVPAPKNPIAALQAQVDAIEQTIAALLGRVTQLEARVSSLSEQVAALVQNPSGAKRNVFTRDMSAAALGDEVIATTIYGEDGCTYIYRNHFIKFSDPSFSLANPPLVQVLHPVQIPDLPGDYMFAPQAPWYLFDGSLWLMFKYTGESHCPGADPVEWTITNYDLTPDSAGNIHPVVVVVQ